MQSRQVPRESALFRCFSNRSARWTSRNSEPGRSSPKRAASGMSRYNQDRSGHRLVRATISQNRRLAMGTIKAIWKGVWDRFAFPKVSDAELERCFQKARHKLPVPVFWLLGKPQSGKTSLIRALTGNTRAEIGNGIRPCTRTAREYPFPSENDCILRFLDTRGLGEVNYDPSDDIAQFQGQAHLLIVV